MELEGDSIIENPIITKNDLLEAYKDYGSFVKAAPQLGINRKRMSKLWKSYGLPNIKFFRKETVKERFSFAAMSDLHIGSNYEKEKERNQFIEYVKSKGITTLVCAGDISDGIYDSKKRNHILERYLHSPDDILDEVVAVYPEDFDTNIFIIGNHDLSLRGFDLGNHIIKMRSDLTYLNQGFSDPYITNPVILDGGAKVVLYHGGGACTKIAETRMRNVTDKFIGLQKWADFYLFGHCHTYGEKRDYLGRTLISLPCFQGITPYMAAKPLIPSVGGLIISYGIDVNDNPVNVSIEYYNQFN